MAEAMLTNYYGLYQIAGNRVGAIRNLPVQPLHVSWLRRSLLINSVSGSDRLAREVKVIINDTISPEFLHGPSPSGANRQVG
jgi:hypothetical protein